MRLPDDIVIIALGSNLGDSSRNIIQAMARLEFFTNEPLRRSSIWETEPVDCPPGSPKFMNAVVALVAREGETEYSLLEKTQLLEKEFGRRPKTVFNEARPLDLDLIAFGRRRFATPELTLPHPRAAERRFVLGPLAEIEAGYILPGQMLTVGELLANLGA